ncbi:TPA: phosphoribosyl-AMP cyclohydrolase [bacterium]|nr:phosphoribosyl-AMP cyclohydrolase [bacterium]
MPKIQLDDLDFKHRGGTIPTIVQDADTGEILTLAYSTEESLKKAIELEESVFWSTSRNEIWHKGATSGNVQKLVEILYDCDGDAMVFKVKPLGPACHTGERTCFYKKLISFTDQ